MQLARCFRWCSGAMSSRKCACAASAGEQATRRHWPLTACHCHGNMRQACIACIQRCGCNGRGPRRAMRSQAHPRCARGVQRSAAVLQMWMLERCRCRHALYPRPRSAEQCRPRGCFMRGAAWVRGAHPSTASASSDMNGTVASPADSTADAVAGPTPWRDKKAHFGVAAVGPCVFGRTLHFLHISQRLAP